MIRHRPLCLVIPVILGTWLLSRGRTLEPECFEIAQNDRPSQKLNPFLVGTPSPIGNPIPVADTKQRT